MYYLLFFLACSDKTTDSANDTDETAALLSRSFLLQEITGYSPTGNSGYIVFRDNDGPNFSFSAECNSLSGAFSITDGVFEASMLAMTEIGCDQALMDDDNWFASFFTSSPNLTLEESTLTFTNSEATLVFLDQEIATPDLDLTEAVWIVDTYIENDAAMAFNISSPPTFEFSDQGDFSFFDACNSGSGLYTLDGSTLTVSEVIATEMACSDEMINEASRFVYDTLAGPMSVDIEASRLTLQNGSIGISAYAQ